MITPEDILFKLLRVALGSASDCSLPENVDWKRLIDLAFSQDVAAISADGMQVLYNSAPDAVFSLDDPNLENEKYEWFMSAMSAEQDYLSRQKALKMISDIWTANGIDFVVLKGLSFAVYYPIPEHRSSCDLDILPLNNWELSNDLLERAGFSVDRREQKHHHITVGGVHVENHQFVCPTKGDSAAKKFDNCLKNLLKEGKVDTFHILFYLKHAQTHFLIEDGITLKHVLDWVFLRRKVSDESNALVSEYGLENFASAIDEVTAFVMGESYSLSPRARVMMDDILAEKKPFSSKGSRFIAHVNILRTVWKRRHLYRDFSTVSALSRMWTMLYGHFIGR